MSGCHETDTVLLVQIGLSRLYSLPNLCPFKYGHQRLVLKQSDTFEEGSKARRREGKEGWQAEATRACAVRKHAAGAFGAGG
jgi:hypothetical protein